MGHQPARSVYVVIPRAALEAIFDECDRYDDHETGGRLIGTYTEGSRGRLTITMNGVIESSVTSRRSATSFFQDGEYQEKIFRSLEADHPEIEHLGNWHTHHMNGYPTLSQGDRETYHRIVNHPKHNTNFFYALLITEKNSGRARTRYSMKHFVLFRGDPGEYELPASHVRVVDEPVLWPQDAISPPFPEEPPAVNADRGRDSQFIEECFPALRPFLAKGTNSVYWRGPVTFVDDTSAEVVVGEVAGGKATGYAVIVKTNPATSHNAAVSKVSERRFGSAREALLVLEREVNREIFRSLQQKG